LNPNFSKQLLLIFQYIILVENLSGFSEGLPRLALWHYLEAPR
jgi:hypothetical protein